MKIEYSCVAQLAEHPTVNRTVTGSSSRRSSPERVTPDGMKIEYSCVAQLAEHPTVNRTVTGSSPVAGAIESLGSPRLFIFIVLVARHDTPSSTGKSMAKTSPLLTSGRQVTVNSPMRGTVFPVSVWEYRANLTSRPWSGAWRSQSGSRGRWGPRRLRPGSRRAWRPWHRCRCRA